MSASPQDYDTVFASAEGQRVLGDILDMGYVTRAFTSNEAQDMAIGEGGRRLALKIQRKYHEGRDAKRTAPIEVKASLTEDGRG